MHERENLKFMYCDYWQLVTLPSAGSISAPPDYATPLTIETSPEPPSTPTTDTASEAGSAYNSPQVGLPFVCTNITQYCKSTLDQNYLPVGDPLHDPILLLKFLPRHTHFTGSGYSHMFTCVDISRCV